MKNFTKKLMGMILVFTMIVTLLPSYTVLANEKKPGVKEIFSSADSKDEVKTLDINGDGKKEKVRIKTTANEYAIESIRIDVNGKKVFETEGDYYPLYVVTVDCITLKSGKKYVSILASTDNDDPVIANIYKYDKSTKRLKKVLDLNTENVKSFSEKIDCGVFHKYINKLSVSGEKIKVEYEGQAVSTGYVKWDISYKLKNGKFVKANSSSAIKENRKFTAKKKITFYNDKRKSKIAFTVKSGDVVSLKKISVYKGKYYLQYSYKGKKGWIYAGKSEIFKNVFLAG